MNRTVCTYCKNEFLLGRFNFCYHCGRPSLYPNVEAAQIAEETGALNSRYNAAIAQAHGQGLTQEIAALENLVASSKAVIARFFGDVVRLSLNDDELYATYFQLVEANAKVPASDKWNRVRAIAEEALFPGYKERISFAILAVDGRGIPHYGDCYLTFREDMTDYRSSTLEENCVYWLEYQTDALGLNLVTDELPHGYKSNWQERHKVVVAKTASALASNMRPDQYVELVVRPRTVTGNLQTNRDHFVEVHIWGPWTRRTLSHVIVTGKSQDDADVQLLKYRLDTVNTTMEIC